MLVTTKVTSKNELIYSTETVIPALLRPCKNTQPPPPMEAPEQVTLPSMVPLYSAKPYGKSVRDMRISVTASKVKNKLRYQYWYLQTSSRQLGKGLLTLKAKTNLPKTNQSDAPNCDFSKDMKPNICDSKKLL